MKKEEKKKRALVQGACLLLAIAVSILLVWVLRPSKVGVTVIVLAAVVLGLLIASAINKKGKEVSVKQSLIVRKEIGTGWTLNMDHPFSYVILIVGIVILTVLIGKL